MLLRRRQVRTRATHCSRDPLNLTTTAGDSSDRVLPSSARNIAHSRSCTAVAHLRWPLHSERNAMACTCFYILRKLSIDEHTRGASGPVRVTIACTHIGNAHTSYSGNVHRCTYFWLLIRHV